MKLAIYQGSSPKGDIEVALETIDRVLTAAGAVGTRMTVFPEVFLPGYNVSDPGQAARTLQEWVGLLSPLAQRAGCGLTVGAAERDGDKVYNSALAIGAGGTLLVALSQDTAFWSHEKTGFTHLVARWRYSILKQPRSHC